MSIRPVSTVTGTRPTLEGAGVHLHRVFGFGDASVPHAATDPFLMMDDFRNDVPAHYAAGFPWHPHRGIETITYVLAGSVEHADSLGNAGNLGPGSVQWMTAGSGILHQEMPRGDDAGRMHGFQLWANLPAAKKMTGPRYQDIAGTDVPSFTDDDGTVVRLITGSWRGQRGPVDGIAADPQYLDVTLPPNTVKTIPIDAYRSAFAYVFDGEVSFRDASAPRGVLVEKEIAGREHHVRDRSGNRTLVTFDMGDEVRATSGEHGARVRQADSRAGRLAWPDRHEHAGRDRAGDARAARRLVHPRVRRALSDASQLAPISTPAPCASWPARRAGAPGSCTATRTRRPPGPCPRRA